MIAASLVRVKANIGHFDREFGFDSHKWSCSYPEVAMDAESKAMRLASHTLVLFLAPSMHAALMEACVGKAQDRPLFSAIVDRLRETQSQTP